MADKTNAPTVAATTKSKTMTKAEAITQALLQIGKDAKPLQLQSHIKKTFGLDVSTNHISAAKTDIIRKLTDAAKPVAATPIAPKPSPTKPPVAKQAAQVTVAPKTAAVKPATKKPAPPKPQGKPTPAATSNGKSSGSVALDDVATVKALVGRVGATTLKTLIDVLAY